MTEQENIIFITESAQKEIQSRLNNKTGLRLGVKGGGCSGFSYVLQFEDLPKDKDYILNINGLNIYIDKKSMFYLNGMTLDWQKTLFEKGFKFINPNQKSICSCGKSFSV